MIMHTLLTSCDGIPLYDSKRKYLGCTVPLNHVFQNQGFGCQIVLNGFHIPRWAMFRAFAFTFYRISRIPKAQQAWSSRFEPLGGATDV